MSGTLRRSFFSKRLTVQTRQPSTFLLFYHDHLLHINNIIPWTHLTVFIVLSVDLGLFTPARTTSGSGIRHPDRCGAGIRDQIVSGSPPAMYQQQPLPGAYYGPAVPPQQQNKSRNCFCCLFGTAVRIFIAVMVLLCILVLVLWLVLRPTEIKVQVTSASLTQFNLTTLAGDSRSLDHNLTTVLTVRNPNERVGLYYDYLDAAAYYGGERFGWQGLPTFYQGHKNTTTLYPAFSGRSVISLSGSNVNDSELQRRAGALDVTLQLRGRIRFKIGSSFTTSRTTLKIDCNLAVPYSPNGAKTGRIFSETGCKVDW